LAKKTVGGARGSLETSTEFNFRSILSKAFRLIIGDVLGISEGARGSHYQLTKIWTYAEMGFL